MLRLQVKALSKLWALPDVYEVRPSYCALLLALLAADTDWC
jgi:hypothetical protein